MSQNVFIIFTVVFIAFYGAVRNQAARYALQIAYIGFALLYILGAVS